MKSNFQTALDAYKASPEYLPGAEQTILLENPSNKGIKKFIHRLIWVYGFTGHSSHFYANHLKPPVDPILLDYNNLINK